MDFVWIWLIGLFFTTFILGIISVLGGIGGGVLFVSIIGGFSPFNLDFVRGTGILIVLSGSLAASPELLKKGLANLKLVIPFALITSLSSLVGAVIGLALPKSMVNIALSLIIFSIIAIMLIAKKSEFPIVPEADILSKILGINGVYYEESTNKEIPWKIHRTLHGFCLFAIIGLIAGMFGVGAGWANVPVFNLIMGVPLKVAVGTSKFLLSITSASASWIYLNNGAILPIIAVPSILGTMLGSVIGAKMFVKTKPKVVRYIVVLLLFFSSLRMLLKGLGIWN